MNDDTIRIRLSNPNDVDGILDVHRDAFGAEEGPVIADLVSQMLADPTSQPSLSMVAEKEHDLVGHVLFTSAKLDSREDVEAQILAPLAVIRDQHGRGIGTRLVSKGLTHLQEKGVDLVFVLGYPDYYSRFDFVPAGVRGFEAPYPILPKNSDAWMVKETSPGAIDTLTGTVRCSNALDHPMYWQE